MSFRELYRRPAGEPIAFDHADVHEALVNGWGRTTHATRQRVTGIVNSLERMDHDLRRTLAKGNWTHAREHDDTTPLTNAVEALREISECFDGALATHSDEFRRARAMPARVEVEALDANLSAAGSQPVGSRIPSPEAPAWRAPDSRVLGSEAGESAGAFLRGQTDKEIDECAANQAEEQARARYRAYRAALTVDCGHNVHIPRVPQAPGESAPGESAPGKSAPGKTAFETSEVGKLEAGRSEPGKPEPSSVPDTTRKNGEIPAPQEDSSQLPGTGQQAPPRNARSRQCGPT